MAFYSCAGPKIRIKLSHPAVIIGPNNSGKTSVIQALSLWDRGVKSWYEKKGEANSVKERERYGAGINRLNILEVPAAETRFLWNKTRVRQKNEFVKMRITIGLEFKGKVTDCPFVFTYRDPEVIYSAPDAAIMKDPALKPKKHFSGTDGLKRCWGRGRPPRFCEIFVTRLRKTTKITIDLFKNPVGSLPTSSWLTSPAKCSVFCHF
jgi:hypothetical protein